MKRFGLTDQEKSHDPRWNIERCDENSAENLTDLKTQTFSEFHIQIISNTITSHQTMNSTQKKYTYSQKIL